MSQSVKIPKVTAGMIMQIVEGLAFSQKRGLSLAEACKYADISQVYARRALDAIVQLGMGTMQSDRFYANSECKSVTKANMAQWSLIFRKFLQTFDPFILFIMLVGKGNSPNDAARKASTIYSIQAPVQIVQSTLLGWGAYADVLEIDRNGKPKLKVETEKLEAEYLKELIEALESDFKARLYTAGKLGDEVFAYVDHTDVEFIVSAIRKHAEDPRSAIENIGRAFEDFLRKVGTDKAQMVSQGQTISDCKGIGQLAVSLKTNKVIHEKHYDLCSYVNAMRLASAHGKEAATMATWTINPDAAIEAILTALTGMRSIHQYVFKNLNIL